MSDRRLVILGYHRIGPPPPGGWESWYFVAEDDFVNHVAALRADGWTFIDAERFLAGLGDPLALPERAVLVTFDDGYRSMVTHALPLAASHGLPAVLFVPSDHVGRRNDFDPAEPQEDICRWEDLRLLERNGIAVESHGASHRAFSDLTADERGAELERSKHSLEENLGKRVRLFAYPYGDVGPDQPGVERQLGRLGYDAAFLYPLGDVPLPVDNPYRLQRIAVGADTDVPAIVESCAGAADPGSAM